MNSFFNAIVSICLIVFLTNCSHSQLDIDTTNSNIKPIVINRLDKEVFKLTPQNIKQSTANLLKSNNAFYNRYCSNIIGVTVLDDSLYTQKIVNFINDKEMNAAFNDVAKTFTENDIELLSENITEAIKRFNVFFPKRNTPKQVVTFMGGFNYNVVYVDSTLAIGLEMYLGANSNFYTMMRLPVFRTRNMTKENVLPDAIRGWMITEFDNSSAPENKLINHMIFYGKLFYLCDALLPNVNDSLKMGYSAQQLAYCKKFESNLWGFFAKDNKLFANDLKTVSEFTNDGPFTGAISKDCPPRIAMWVGLQLVKSYMQHNPKITVSDLMTELDAQKILSKSKYKP